MELMRYRDDFRPPDCVVGELFVDQDGDPLTTNVVQCGLRRLRAKLAETTLGALAPPNLGDQLLADGRRRPVRPSARGGLGRPGGTPALLRRGRHAEGRPRFGDGSPGAGAQEGCSWTQAREHSGNRSSSGDSGGRKVQIQSLFEVEASPSGGLYSESLAVDHIGP